MVSRAACTADHRINSATTRPTQPSSCTLVSLPITIASSTAEVAAVSLRLSAAVADMAADLIFFPTARLYRYMYSFTPMEASKIPAASHENVTASGWRILSTEDFASSAPISRIRPATIKPETYSSRPWPKGCPASGFFPASRKPSSVTTEEPASERLLKASAVMAMEPLRVPATSFPANSRMFNPIPTKPQSAPHARRTAPSSTCSRLGINHFASTDIIRLSFLSRPLFRWVGPALRRAVDQRDHIQQHRVGDRGGTDAQHHQRDTARNIPGDQR